MSDPEKPSDPATDSLFADLRKKELDTRLPDHPILTDGEMLFAGAVRRLLREKHGLLDHGAWEVAILACRSLKKLGRLTGMSGGKVAEMAVGALKREGVLK